AALNAALLLAALAAAPLAAGTLAGVTMPETATADGHQLQLNGMGLRSKAIFKVYVAGLYLPDKESDWNKVLGEDEPRRVVMHWVLNVGKDLICEGWHEGLEANNPKASADVKKNFDALCTKMEDAKTGDRFTFTYLPGKGTEVAINDKVKGEPLGGKPFADALFACWIGPHPVPGEAFRDGLMGKAK
ncbi:MAG TPA: chalcone isomerase family protein, partial [Thermoanaerobaculia bacterium]|nr:chalcone isomerase family protein [Thermoanaerobaculia bacterium]